MACAVFTTKTELATFISAIAADLGLPRPGRKQSDGRLMFENCWTNAQFDIRVATVNVAGTNRTIGLIANIPPAAVTRYNLNTLTDITPILDAQGHPTGQWLVTYNATQYTVTLVDDPINFPYRLPIPATWTDPQNNITYDTATGKIVA